MAHLLHKAPGRGELHYKMVRRRAEGPSQTEPKSPEFWFEIWHPKIRPCLQFLIYVISMTHILFILYIFTCYYTSIVRYEVEV